MEDQLSTCILILLCCFAVRNFAEEIVAYSEAQNVSPPHPPTTGKTINSCMVT